MTDVHEAKDAIHRAVRAANPTAFGHQLRQSFAVQRRGLKRGDGREREVLRERRRASARSPGL
jgi:hypothetical protein